VARKTTEIPQQDARERILRTAYELQSRHGFQRIGVDRISDEAGVSKMTLYRHFGSKEELVLAVLDRREEIWSKGWLEAEVEQRGGTAPERLLAIFEVFDGWFRRPDYEGCLFVGCLLESHDRTSVIGAASVRALERIRSFVRRLAGEAGVRDPEELARQWQILMVGSISAAVAGDADAALRARDVAALVLEHEVRRPDG
jgi:AcrR family transcriptional regulator